MNHRIKKKLTKRFNHFHYKDYKNERKRSGLKKSDLPMHFVPVVRQTTFRRMSEMLGTMEPPTPALIFPGFDLGIGYPITLGRKDGVSIEELQHISNYLIRMSSNEQPLNEQAASGTIINVQLIKSRSANQLEGSCIIN